MGYISLVNRVDIEPMPVDGKTTSVCTTIGHFFDYLKENESTGKLRYEVSRFASDSFTSAVGNYVQREVADFKDYLAHAGEDISKEYGELSLGKSQSPQFRKKNIVSLLDCLADVHGV